MVKTANFLPAYEALEKERGADSLTPLRKGGIARFAETGLPHSRLEDWRFTDVSALYDADFALARPTAAPLTSDDVTRLATRSGLVFLDGHYCAELSHVPQGIAVRSLTQALDDPASRALVRQHLGHHADKDRRPFVSLNTAFVEDGVFLHVPQNTKIDEPIHVLFVSTDKASHPRNLIVVEDGAEAHLIETWVSLGDAAHYVNAVTESVIGANAHLYHDILQLENDAALHTTAHHVLQGRDSRLTNHVISLGGALVRNDLVVALDGEGIDTTMNGLVLARGRQHIDNHTWIEHRKPNCDSHELYKAILDDQASAVFSGYIHVFQDAQKTDAKQSSANLLLSDRAVIDTQPQLEIYADDVKCTHGATIGQLDEDALFYLRARGLPPAQARNLLVHAFASDVTDGLSDEAARARVEKLLHERLPGDAPGA